MSKVLGKGFVESRQLKGSEIFRADLDGIRRLKEAILRGDDDSFDRPEKHLYLRKGEDFGAFFQMMLDLVSLPPAELETVFSAFMSEFPTLGSFVDLQSLVDLTQEGIEEFYKFMTENRELLLGGGGGALIRHLLPKAKAGVGGFRIDYRIMCNPSIPTERARFGWALMKRAKVKHYCDSTYAGSHRFYISDKAYVFFVRRPDETFFGFKGTDSDVIRQLKDQFEEEWDSDRTKKPGPFPWAR